MLWEQTFRSCFSYPVYEEYVIFFGKTMMFIPTSNRFLRAKIAVANRLFSMKAKAKPNKMLAQPRSISLNQGRRGVWNLSNTISTPCFSWRHPNKKNINPKDHWTLQWKGLNLYGRGWVLKNSQFWGIRILREVKLPKQPDKKQKDINALTVSWLQNNDTQKHNVSSI